MSMPISSRISPPAISNAGSVMPNIRKINCPASAKAVSTIKQVSAALPAILRRRAVSAPSVIAMNEGIAANGSTRKKIELSASRLNRTYVECNSCHATPAGPETTLVSTQSAATLPPHKKPARPQTLSQRKLTGFQTGEKFPVPGNEFNPGKWLPLKIPRKQPKNRFLLGPENGIQRAQGNVGRGKHSASPRSKLLRIEGRAAHERRKYHHHAAPHPSLWRQYPQRSSATARPRRGGLRRRTRTRLF